MISLTGIKHVPRAARNDQRILNRRDPISVIAHDRISRRLLHANTSDRHNRNNIQRGGCELAAAGSCRFWGDDCPKCESIAPIIDELAEELAGQVKVVKFWAQPDMATIHRYQLRGIPTLMLFREGEPVQRLTGFYRKDEILRIFGL